MDLDELYKSYHSTSIFQNGTDFFWIFYKNQKLYKFIHRKRTVHIPHQIPQYFKIIQHQPTNTSKFYLENISCIPTISETINKPQLWLIDNIKYINKSNEALAISLNIVKFLNLEIGNYIFRNFINYTWNIPGFFTITLDIYNSECTLILNTDGIETKLSEKELRIFITKNKNKNKIQKFQKIQLEHLKLKKQQLEQQKITKKQLEQQTLEQLKIDPLQPKVDATRKVNSKKNCINFYIKQTNKQIYEMQGCKPYPTKEIS